MKPPPVSDRRGVSAGGTDNPKPILLIVEDDTFWRRWYIESLSEAYNLRFASDARTAVQRVAQYHPVAIICDRHIDPIPRGPSISEDMVAGIDRTIAAKSYVDGWQFLRQLRKSVFRHTPVILVTEDSPGGMNWVRQKLFSPDGFITKGKITREELIVLLDTVIRQQPDIQAEYAPTRSTNTGVLPN